MGCHFLLEGIFPIQGLNPRLLRSQADFLPLSHQGSPLTEEGMATGERGSWGGESKPSSRQRHGRTSNEGLGGERETVDAERTRAFGAARDCLLFTESSPHFRNVEFSLRGGGKAPCTPVRPPFQLFLQYPQIRLCVAESPWLLFGPLACPIQGLA